MVEDGVAAQRALLTQFEDFDIDFNQYKYLLETRLSGALTKLKSAQVFVGVASGVTIVTASR